MSAEWLRALARYNRWMNENLYRVSASLSDEERKQDRGAFFKSIHATFNHLLVADRIWLARFRGDPVAAGDMGPGGIHSLDQELYADFEELRRERTLTDTQFSKWIDEVTDEQLLGPLPSKRSKGRETPLWCAVSHLFNHQTHHRGQITTLLSQAGRDPGVTDLFAMLQGERRA